MENDLWLNIKQHASVWNIIKYVFLIRAVAHYRAKEVFPLLQDNHHFPDSSTVSTLLLHILPLCFQVVS